MKKPYCTICNKEGHYQSFCYVNRKAILNKTPIKRKSGKYVSKDTQTKKQWMKDNATASGYWSCYLRISPMCLRVVDKGSLSIEHVIPKGRGMQYRHDQSNLKASCVPCNSLKGSRTIQSLAKQYPHLQKYC